MMEAGFSYTVTICSAAVLHTPTASGSHVFTPALGFALLVPRLRCHRLVQPSKQRKAVKVRMSGPACGVALALRSAVGRRFVHRGHCGA